MLLLTCQVCGWRPNQSQELSVVRQHFDDEHGGAPIAMSLVAYCPRHDVPLKHRFTGVVRATGRNVTTYDCPVDDRTYRVKWSPNNL